MSECARLVPNLLNRLALDFSSHVNHHLWQLAFGSMSLQTRVLSCLA
jgi:hypothetical protein